MLFRKCICIGIIVLFALDYALRFFFQKKIFIAPLKNSAASIFYLKNRRGCYYMYIKIRRNTIMEIYKLPPKIISVILAIAMLLTLIPSIIHAQEEITISVADELISLAYSTDKADFSKNYRLLNDIDMSETGDERIMKAIGSYSGGSNDIAFSGVFDGGGHKIINLSTTGEALFGYVGSTGIIKNLTLEKASVHYRQNSSSKYPAALAALNRGEIQNCFSIHSTVVSDYCSPAGGLVGTNFGNVSKCGVSGGSVSFAVSRTGTSHGGFVGNQRGGVIEECFSTASVNAKKWAGGFVGKFEDGIISDCYARGNVSGSEENGGFAGAFMDGYNDEAILKNVYCTGDVTAKTGGGLAGGKGFSFASQGIPQNCWYCSDSALPEEEGAFKNDSAWGISSAAMISAEFAARLSDKWAYDEHINDGYPYLIHAAPPTAETDANKITAQVRLAAYDKNSYEFYQLSEPFDVTVKKNAATVKDILEAAAENGDVTYAFGENGKSGQIVTINDITPQSPDGWMFSVNGVSSAVGAASAMISDGDTLLWYVGTPENGYTAPDWDHIGLPSDDITVIHYVSELLELAETPDQWNGNYKLSDNIDLSGIAFSPIGNQEQPFSGSFDGNGFEISGLTITGDKASQNIGMFGVVHGARLKNITLKDVNITGGSVVGGLVGKAESDADDKSVTLITDCHVSGSVTAIGTSFAKQTDAGGLAGINDSAENRQSGDAYLSVINRCTADVAVTGNTGAADISDAGHIGGLVGLNKGMILNSSASGNVAGGNTTGGFVGSNYGGSIYFSHASGNVSGAYTVGGFAGSAGLYTLIENSYSTGAVTAIGTSGSYFGGFAGVVSGKLKNCISSGSLTAGWSYNGGFAGWLDGCIWSYNDDLRSISNCCGNSVTSGGEKIKALGNYIGGIHAPTDLAAEKISVDKETAERKISEMLNHSSAENKLMNEAGKYKTNTAIPSTVQASSDITALVAKLNANVSADDEIKLSYKSGGSMIQSNPAGYILSEKPAKDMEETVTLSLSLGDAEYEQPITVTLYSAEKQTDQDALLKNIADRYASGGTDYWEIVTLGAYNKSFDKAELSDKAKSEFVSRTVRLIAETDKDTTLAMNIIALRSLGFNPSDITLEDGTKINAAEKLAKAPSTGNNGDAYRLLAYQACGYRDQEEITAVIDRLLAAQLDKKGWSNNKDDGIDADSTGAVLLGLAAFYDSNPSVKAAADNAVDYLSTLMQADGNIKSSYKESNYGTNANTSAICAIGLEALGINIKSDERFIKSGVSLFDGIMSFASDDETGFVYEYGSAATNEFATKQAALAIMAAERSGNILDFSDMPSNAVDLKKPVNAGTNSNLGGGSGGGSSINNAPKKIEVYFTLIGDSAHGNEQHTSFSEWIKEIKIETAENAKAREVIEKALKDNGYSAKGLENGYISEIATPDGIILGEYTNGEQSGWRNSVHGEYPSVGINDYTVKSGDKIKLYYADSWNSVSFPDVKSGDWFFDAAQFAAQNGLIQGNENGEFMPDDTLTRAMAVTVLGRLDGGANDTAPSCNFTDVTASDWFHPYVNWAVQTGVVFGIDNDAFAQNDSITREQLAAMLYRYAKSKKIAGETAAADLTEYSDSGSISAWAADAMRWAIGAQLISGMGDGSVAPNHSTTRAQFAMILMRLNHLTK